MACKAFICRCLRVACLGRFFYPGGGFRRMIMFYNARGVTFFRSTDLLLPLILNERVADPAGARSGRFLGSSGGGCVAHTYTRVADIPINDIVYFSLPPPQELYAPSDHVRKRTRISKGWVFNVAMRLERTSEDPHTDDIR